MEYYTNELGFLEELLGLRGIDEEQYYPENQAFNNIDYSFFNNIIPSSSSNYTTTNSLEDHVIDYSNFFLDHYQYNPYGPPFGNHLSPPEFSTVDSETTNLDSQTFPYNYYTIPSDILDNDEEFGNAGVQSLDMGAPCKVEPVPEMPTFNIGSSFPQNERKAGKVMKKLNGQPSKNLMAERRRRKRLNDRLSMLRSVVPKISKMDRTSILGDTIDYMKELLERINNLQEEMDLGSNELSLMSVFKEVKPNEILVRNSPKFDVERRSEDTKIEICCASKPGLLLSTVTTLEALGLEIHQCVISCFNEFAIQASCSEEFKNKSILDSEDIKQALVRNAGYGGRCL